MQDENFLDKLEVQGKEHHLCYKCIDLAETLVSKHFYFFDIKFAIQINYALTCVTATQTLDSFLKSLYEQLSSAKESSTLQMKHST